MIFYIKKQLTISKYKEYGELMGELLSGQITTDLNTYFEVKQKYINLRDNLLKFGVHPVRISAWVRLIGGWSKKYPRIEKIAEEEYQNLLESDLSELKTFERNRYKSV